MDPIFLIEYVLLFLAFGVYQVWAFLNGKSLKTKLLPMFAVCAFGIILSFFVTWYIFMFAVVLLETTLFVTMAVLLVEMILTLKKSGKKSRVIMLALFELFVILVYFWLQRVI